MSSTTTALATPSDAVGEGSDGSKKAVDYAGYSLRRGASQQQPTGGVPFFQQQFNDWSSFLPLMGMLGGAPPIPPALPTTGGSGVTAIYPTLSSTGSKPANYYKGAPLHTNATSKKGQQKKQQQAGPPKPIDATISTASAVAGAPDAGGSKKKKKVPSIAKAEPTTAEGEPAPTAPTTAGFVVSSPHHHDMWATAPSGTKLAFGIQSIDDDGDAGFGAQPFPMAFATSSGQWGKPSKKPWTALLGGGHGSSGKKNLKMGDEGGQGSSDSDDGWRDLAAEVHFDPRSAFSSSSLDGEEEQGDKVSAPLAQFQFEWYAKQSAEELPANNSLLLAGGLAPAAL